MDTWDQPRLLEITPMECAIVIGSLRGSQTKAAEAGDWDDVDEIGAILDRLHEVSGLPR